MALVDIDQLLATKRPGWQWRDRQRDTLVSVLAGRNTVGVMPTGSGKTLVFELAASAKGSGCLVISPLVALMGQQAGRLGEQYPSLTLGGMNASTAMKEMRAWHFEGTSFLFTSPERMEDDAYLEHRLRAERHRIGLVVIDEVHCVSQWGHSFRPHYRAIAGVLDRVFGPSAWPTVLGLTATVSERDLVEVCSEFRVDPGHVIRSVAGRPNLTLCVEELPDEEAKAQRLIALLEAHRDEKIIVYTHRKESEKWGTRALAERCRLLGHRAEPFDADLEPEAKRRVLDEFTSGQVRVVFATGAFGMGIDIADIRGVIHYLLPESIEQFHQEVGRAGRDGDPAFGHLLYTETNARVRRDLVARPKPTEKALRQFWTDVLEDQAEVIPSDAFSKDHMAAWFYAFVRAGVVKIEGKGPSSLNAYEPTARGSPAFDRLRNATKRGRIRKVAEALALTPSEVVRELNEIFDRGEIRLARAPERCVYVSAGQLTDEQLASVTSALEATTARRLGAVDRLVAAIRDGSLVTSRAGV